MEEALPVFLGPALGYCLAVGQALIPEEPPWGSLPYT